MILLPYLFSALYSLKLVAIDGQVPQGARWFLDLSVAVLASVYCLWLLYAAGAKYLLLSSLRCSCSRQWRLTMPEFGEKPLHELSFCYLGDARFNMGCSLLVGGTQMGMDVRLAAPAALMPPPAAVVPYPLDVLGAQTEGMIGYLLEQELSNHLPPGRSVVTLLTRVEVDPDDPDFRHPTKPVGPLYTRQEKKPKGLRRP